MLRFASWNPAGHVASIYIDASDHSWTQVNLKSGVEAKQWQLCP